MSFCYGIIKVFKCKVLVATCKKIILQNFPERAEQRATKKAGVFAVKTPAFYLAALVFSQWREDVLPTGSPPIRKNLVTGFNVQQTTKPCFEFFAFLGVVFPQRKISESIFREIKVSVK